jgi:hypothetical protein
LSSIELFRGGVLQITDVEGEVYGLQTYDRAVIKPDISKVVQVNQTLISASKALNS